MTWRTCVLACQSRDLRKENWEPLLVNSAFSGKRKWIPCGKAPHPLRDRDAGGAERRTGVPSVSRARNRCACRSRGSAPRAGGSTRSHLRVDVTAGWRLRLASAHRSRLERSARESVRLRSPCQQSMEIKRASTANERISLPGGSAARHCGKHCQLPRRDVRTVATCRRCAKPALVKRRRGQRWRPLYCCRRSANHYPAWHN